MWILRVKCATHICEWQSRVEIEEYSITYFNEIEIHDKAVYIFCENLWNFVEVSDIWHFQTFKSCIPNGYIIDSSFSYLLWNAVVIVSMVVSTVPKTREKGPITIRAMCHLCRSVQYVGTNERIVKVVVPLALLATADLLTNILYCSFPFPRKQGGCYLTIYCFHRTMLHPVFTKCLVMY